MPSRTRQEHLVARIRDEFRRNARATAEDYELLVAAGESHLETLQVSPGAAVYDKDRTIVLNPISK